MSTRRPGEEGLLDRELREQLRRAGRKGMTASALSRAGGETWSEEEIGERLRHLAIAGEAVEWQRRWFLRRFTDLRVGRVRGATGGRAQVADLVDPGASWEIARADLKGARDGDRVLVRPRRGRERRSADRAVVVRRLAPDGGRLVGTLEPRRNGGFRLVPFDRKETREVTLREAGDDPAVVEGRAWVVVEPEPGAKRSGGALDGRIVEVLGETETPGVDVEVVLAAHGIPDAFPNAVAEAAAALPADPGPDDWRGRRDLRDLVTVTIDGGQARDFDDAISVEKAPGGGYRVGVHIADVSHYVAEGGTLDLEAYRRGTSVYFPERAVPMLPERISNGLCSLRPGVPRLVVSALLDVTPAGKVRRHRFARGVIVSKRRLTYDEVRRLLEEPRPGDAAEYGEVLPLLERAQKLMRALHRVRMGRGSLDFDLPHGDVILDTEGVTVDVRPGQRHVAHRIIEECMLAANEAVARELEASERPALHRVHDPPSEERLEELADTLAPLGLELDVEEAVASPQALQEVLAAIEGRPEEPFVSSLVLRAMKRALYQPEPTGHYALATDSYTHFTSPIRRYPDLLVHRQITALAAGHRGGGDGLAERLPAIGEHCSSTERRAERAERQILQWKLVRLLADRVGETFEGRVTGVQPFGLFVQLTDYFVDGLLPVSSLDDDFYEYDAEGHRLVGRSGGRIFRLADAIEVELTEVDVRRRGLILGLAGGGQRDASRDGRRKGHPHRGEKRGGTRGKERGEGRRRQAGDEGRRGGRGRAGRDRRSEGEGGGRGKGGRGGRRGGRSGGGDAGGREKGGDGGAPKGSKRPRRRRRR